MSIIRAGRRSGLTVLLPNAPRSEGVVNRRESVEGLLLVKQAHPELAVAAAVDAIGASDRDAPSSLKASLESPDHLAEREAAKEAAAEIGYEDGLQRGEAAAAKTWSSKIEDFDLLIESFQKEREELMTKLEDDLVCVAFDAVCAVLGTEEASRPILRHAVRKATASTTADSPIVVRISPAQLAQFSEEDRRTLLGRRKGAVELVEDVRVEAGGCIVETGRGTLDARLETQIDRLKKALLTARTQE